MIKKYQFSDGDIEYFAKEKSVGYYASPNGHNRFDFSNPKHLEGYFLILNRDESIRYESEKELLEKIKLFLVFQ